MYSINGERVNRRLENGEEINTTESREEGSVVVIAEATAHKQ
jgi:hypothetical protein